MIDLKLEEFLFESYTLSFSIPYDDPKSVDIFEDAPVEYEGEIFFITTVEDSRDDTGKAIKRVEAEARWMRLADISRPGDSTLSQVTVARGLELILQGTGWSVGELTEDDNTYSLQATDSSVLNLLWQWAGITGNEILFHTDNPQIGFIPRVGVNAGVSFRYATNLKTIKRTIKPPSTTRVFAFGRDDLDITGYTDRGVQYLEDYSYYTGQGLSLEEAKELYRKDLVLVNDDQVEASGLYSWAQSQLELFSQPQITYHASVVDLSRITLYPGTSFRCGDVVRVVDEPLGMDLLARVTRRVIYPNEPERNEVELTFGQVQIPTPSVKTARDSQTKSWELFESRNWDDIRQVFHIPIILNRLFLRTIEDAEWIVHYTVEGVANTTGEVTFEFIDTNHLDGGGNPIVLWPAKTFSLTDGEEFNYSWSFSQKEIAAGEYELSIRATSSTFGAGAEIPAAMTAFWVLARGTTRTKKTYLNSVRFDYTSSGVQHWTVPEFVSEVRIQCVGGGTQSEYGGSGGSVSASLYVTPFEEFDIYAPDRGNDGKISRVGTGWPNGGNGDFPGFSSSGGGGGGGSASIRRAGTGFEDSLIVAPAGGGQGEGQEVIYQKYGGDGRFIHGEDGKATNGNYGYGASQSAGGAAGAGGTDGSFGQGGDAGASSNSFAFGGGGGGGGWYGGGGAATADGAGYGAGGGGGGGGSGWVSDQVFDVEIEDGYNEDESGWVIISWPDIDDSIAEYSGLGS